MLAKCQYLALTEVGAGAEAGVGGLEVDPHQGATGLPPQVPKIVVGGKRHPPRKCPAYNQVCKRCKIKDHFKQFCKTKNPGGTYQPRGSRREQFEVSRGPEQPPSYSPGSDYEFCEDSIDFIFNMGPKASKSDNILFDEISNTQVLGDVKLANRAGKQLTQRFKLDSGACANLLPIGIYNKLFSKQDRDLRGSIDPRVSLIAANKNSPVTG